MISIDPSAFCKFPRGSCRETPTFLGPGVQDEERLELARNEVEVLRRAGHEAQPKIAGEWRVVLTPKWKNVVLKIFGDDKNKVQLLIERDNF